MTRCSAPTLLVLTTHPRHDSSQPPTPPGPMTSRQPVGAGEPVTARPGGDASRARHGIADRPCRRTTLRA